MEKKSLDELGVDIDARFDTHYYTALKRSEFLRRLAFNAGHNSVNRILDEIAYPRTWQKDLERMRVEHRKLGYPDYEFYPAGIKKRLGVKFKPGRHRRILTSSAT